MRTMVGFLVLDRLSDSERSTVEFHLDSCQSCRTERDAADRVVAALSLLTPEDARALIDEFAVDPAAAPSTAVMTDHLFTAPGAEPAVPTQATAAPSPAVTPDGRRPRRSPAVDRAEDRKPHGADRHRSPRVAVGFLPPRPTTGPLSRGPHTHRSRRSRRTVRAALAAIGMAIVIGAGFLFVPTDSIRHPAPSPVVAVASTQDVLSGIQLTAVIYGGEEGARVRLTVTGLGIYTPCQLFAVTTGDVELALGELTGGDDIAQYVGIVTIPVDRLRSFSVRQLDGTVVVEADVVHGSPSASRDPAPE